MGFRPSAWDLILTKKVDLTNSSRFLFYSILDFIKTRKRIPVGCLLVSVVDVGEGSLSQRRLGQTPPDRDPPRQRSPQGDRGLQDRAPPPQERDIPRTETPFPVWTDTLYTASNKCIKTTYVWCHWSYYGWYYHPRYISTRIYYSHSQGCIPS